MNKSAFTKTACTMEHTQTPAEMVAEIRSQLEAKVDEVHRLEKENIARIVANKCQPNGVALHSRVNRFLKEDIEIARREIDALLDLLDNKLALL